MLLDIVSMLLEPKWFPHMTIALLTNRNEGPFNVSLLRWPIYIIVRIYSDHILEWIVRVLQYENFPIYTFNSEDIVPFCTHILVNQFNRFEQQLPNKLSTKWWLC